MASAPNASQRVVVVLQNLNRKFRAVSARSIWLRAPTVSMPVLWDEFSEALA